MNSKIWFIFTLLCLVAVAAAIICGETRYALVALSIGIFCILMFYRSTALPMRAIRSGMDLLRSQDFASRLRNVGQKDADEVVTLYNTVMANMKAERLKNLEQNNFLSKLIEASPMGIAICRLDGSIESTNPTFKTLSSPELMETLATLPPDGQCIFRPGGTQVLRCARRFFMDRGFRRPFYFVERLTDEIVRAETSMFHKIVRTMGHEVNNTLGGVVSVLETLSDIHADDAPMSDALASCRASCINLGNFVKGYSDVVKLPEPDMQPVDLNTFVLNTLSFLRKMCPPGITVTADVTGKPATVLADEMLMQRVLVNAVKNSYESIGERGGNITIRTSPGSLEVIDNGAGISAEAASRIFTPFFSTKRADRGLGLMLIADILRKHKATFSLATGEDSLTRLTIKFAK